VRVIASLLLAICVPAVLLLGWVGFPLSPALAGISFPLLGHWRAGSGPLLVSYGSAASLLLLLAAVARWRESFGWLYFVATGLLLLTAAAMLQVGFGDPVMLKRLADEADWQQAAQQFNLRNLPTNFGSEAVVWPTLPLATTAQRLIAGWYFMGVGWYVTMIAALAAAVTGLSGIRASRLSFMVVVVGFLLMTFATFVTQPLEGQYAILAASNAEAQGDAHEASRLYLKAMKLDGWNALRTDLRERLGEVRANLGQTGAPEYRIYRAEILLARGRVSEAIAQYDTLATCGGELGLLATSRAAAIWTNLGLQLYETGSFGGAVQAWEQALAREPSNWLAAFWLTRGDFAVGRYHAAVSVAERLLKSSDPVALANLYSNLGDARMRAGALGAGRSAYRSSYQSDYVCNRRAIASLVGP
jgi:hypothetical protein